MLTDVQARKAKAADKDYKLADSGGLYLFVTKTGFRSWRLKYRFAGKEKRLVLGPYPEVSLAEAREQREAARRWLREGVDPGVERKRRRPSIEAVVAATFEAQARAWHTAQAPRWVPQYAALILRSLERDIFPEVGSLPLSSIEPPLILAALRKIEARGSIESAKRIRQFISSVYAYAIAEGVAVTDPSASVGRALRPLVKKRKQPAVTRIDDARQLMSDVDQSTADVGTRIASRLLALTAVRPGIAQGARWSEFEAIDWSHPSEPAPAAVWRVPAGRMKLELERKHDGGFDQLVPLSRQAVAALHEARSLSSYSPFVFPGHWSTAKPISNNTLGVLYRRLGYTDKHVPHGWRSTFSTIMNERVRHHGHPGDRAVIDLMLAHVPTGLSSSEAAYNRSEHMERRRELGQEWADLLAPDQV